MYHNRYIYLFIRCPYSIASPKTKNLKGNPMKAVIFETPNAVFEFDQKEVKEIRRCNWSRYDLDQVANLQDLISTECKEIIVVQEEPIYFDSIALDLIKTSTGYGSVFCKTCNKKYSVKQLKSIKVGVVQNHFSLGRKKESEGYSKRGANHQQCMVAKDTLVLQVMNFSPSLPGKLSK